MSFFCGDEGIKDEFTALIAFQNSGNIPLMLVTTLFSGEMMSTLYVYIFLLVIGFNVAIWTLGVSLLIKKESAGIEWDKVFNPPFLATVITLVIIALGWQRWVPSFVVNPVGILGNCALPIAMLVVGGNLAAIDLLDVNKKAISLVIITKLILMPLLAILVILILRLNFAFGFLVLLEAAVPSGVTLSLISRYYHVERKFVNQGLLFTHTACVVTLPVFLTIYLMLRPAP